MQLIHMGILFPKKGDFAEHCPIYWCEIRVLDYKDIDVLNVLKSAAWCIPKFTNLMYFCSKQIYQPTSIYTVVSMAGLNSF